MTQSTERHSKLRMLDCAYFRAVANVGAFGQGMYEANTRIRLYCVDNLRYLVMDGVAPAPPL